MPTQSSNVYLIGLMGAGKTTLGRYLAKQLQQQFVDADAEIEVRTGVSVSAIFDIEGEAGFRQRESALMAELAQQRNLVVATGGGVVLNPDNCTAMRNSGLVIYLVAQPPMLYERIRQDRSRPLLNVADPLARLTELFKERDPIYRATAHFVVAASMGKASRLAEDIAAQIDSLRSLPPDTSEYPLCAKLL